MPLFQQKNQALKKLKSFSANKEKDIQKLVENNLETIFEMWLIATEYSITAGRRIDSFAVDSNGSPVIIEYKKRNDENVINQSISYLKWLKEQKPEFFQKMVENHVKNLPKDFKLRWEQPRVICIAEAFNKYDLDTVEMIKEIKIELYKYRFFEENLFQLEQYNVEEKPDSVLQKKGVFTSNDTSVESLLSKCSEHVKSIFSEMRDRIFQLDTNVEERVTSLYVAYRLSKHFVELHFNKNDIKVYLRPVDFVDPKGLIEKIPDGYNWSMNRRVYIKNMEELEYVMQLIKQSYNDVL